MEDDQEEVLCPPVLHHYTTAAGLHGIVRDGHVWATEYRYLNDEQEVKYALNLARERVHEEMSEGPHLGIAPRDSQVLKEEYRRALLDVMLGMIDAADVHGEVGSMMCMFVTSFSAEENDLSQWRAYGGESGRYSLGISKDTMIECVQRSREGGPAKRLRLIKVEYDQSKQKEMIDGALKKALDQWYQSSSELVATKGAMDLDEADIYRAKAEDFKELMRICTTRFLFDLFRIGPKLKHPSFKNEEEWRLVHSTDRSHADGYELKFRIGSSVPIPYVELPLWNDPKKIELENLWIGPVPHRATAKHSVKLLLDDHGATYGDVKVTDTPFRGGAV